MQRREGGEEEKKKQNQCALVPLFIRRIIASIFILMIHRFTLKCSNFRGENLLECGLNYWDIFVDSDM